MTDGPFLVVAGSTRPTRRSPAIAGWVAKLGEAATGEAFKVIDLCALNLSVDDEPAIPARGVYACETTRMWSAEVTAARGVVFVSPQYNWGYPAPLKNAIDHLYREWKDKPGLIITYGGHGGDKCAAQLRQVLTAVGMQLVEAAPGLILTRSQIEADNGAVDPELDFAGNTAEIEAALRALTALG